MSVPESDLVNESRCLLDLSSGSLAETKYSTAFSLSWSLVRFEYKHYVLKRSNNWISYTLPGISRNVLRNSSIVRLTTKDKK